MIVHAAHAMELPTLPITTMKTILAYIFYLVNIKFLLEKKKDFGGKNLIRKTTSFPTVGMAMSTFSSVLQRLHAIGEIRPIQCRTFPPFAPYLDEDEFFYMIYENAELPYECPLITEKIPLNENFIKATYTAWKHLLSDPLIYDLVEFDSVNRREENNPIEIVYP